MSEMPGPVSDSYDPEFGTGQNANDVREALQHLRKQITHAIGTEELDYIVHVVHRQQVGVRGKAQRVPLYETELRLIRFAIDRALESI
jgi:hypothetical protein